MISDEGFGVHAVKALEQDSRVPPGVELFDGGTQGLYLLHLVEDARRLLILDAAIPSAEGVRVYRNKEIKALLQPAMSAHQTGIHSLMALAQLHEQEPEDIYLVAVAAVSLVQGLELSPPVQALMPLVLDESIAILQRWAADQ